MLTLIKDLFLYQAWADATLLASVVAEPQAGNDERLLWILNHTITVQRYFLSLVLNRSFDFAAEQKAPGSMRALAAVYRETESEFRDCLSVLREEDLTSRSLNVPFIQANPMLGEALMQVALHGQNHRGQSLTRLRELGGKPPTLDYIIWTKSRPGAVWPD
jgi:uncharacterized damage-inducible protein DinB